MKKIKGIAVSPGVAIGRAHILRADEYVVAERQIEDLDIGNEIARFEDALTKTRSQLLGIRKRLSGEMGREHSDIFNAHLLILEDRTLIEDVIKTVRERKVNIEVAFNEVIQRYFHAFSQIDDEYLRERISDIKDIGRRVLLNLLGEESRPLAEIKEKAVVIAHDLSPTDTATLDRTKVIGFATDIGGPTSHTAIMARSLEIPAVVGLEFASREVASGETVVIDGNRGFLIVAPDDVTVERYLSEEKRFIEFTHELDKLRDLPAVTSDGHKIILAANIEFPDEIPSVIAHGSEGIGLYRTEYFYMNRHDLPTEEEQFVAYCKVAEKLDRQPVIIRTLDLGGDKFLSSIDLPHEMNPFLGWRAIRFCLTRVDIFKTQLRAILRASAHGNLKVMYPMICNVRELRQANQILAEVKEDLRVDKVPFDEKIEVGAMIEIPSAALTSDLLAREVNFFSIGTNDLIQYALAVDRVNEKIAYLYEPTHPAILKLISQVIEAGHRANIWVGVCGEMSGDPALAILMLGLGIDELSMSPYMLPKVKKAIRAFSLQEAINLAQDAMRFETGAEIKKFCDDRLGEVIPELIET